MFSKHTSRPAAKPASQRAIDSERTTQIQTALIKSGYMSGTASGVWDSETQSAMQKLQADNGWQTKMIPDSRAIIKLGLGSSTSPASAVASSSPTENAQTTLEAPNTHMMTQQ